MVRTQIQLTEQQAKLLKVIASAQDISMAELIRQLIDQGLQKPKVKSLENRRELALSAIGKFKSGKKDIAENHDAYLDEVYGT